MKLSKAGQVLKGPLFPNKRSEGASFCLATHPPRRRTPVRPPPAHADAPLCTSCQNSGEFRSSKTKKRKKKKTFFSMYLCLLLVLNFLNGFQHQKKEGVGVVTVSESYSRCNLLPGVSCLAHLGGGGLTAGRPSSQTRGINVKTDAIVEVPPADSSRSPPRAPRILLVLCHATKYF